MNIGKLTKTDEELKDLEKTITQNMTYLKTVHMDLIAESALIPLIGEMDYVNFYRDCLMPDEQFKASSIDLIWT